MTSWNKKERLQAVLSGEMADRPPIAAWQHFISREENAADLAAATTEFQQKYDWDFIKINPRAPHFAEAWGNTYDYRNYEGVVPKVSSFLINKAEDINKVIELKGDVGPFNEQLEVIKSVRNTFNNETPLLQTLFSPLAILEYLCGYRTLASNREVRRSGSPLPELLTKDSQGVHQALKNIAYTLADYVKMAMDVGVDGFFYAVLGLRRDGYLTDEEYKTYAEPYDQIVLEAAQHAHLLLHTCGPNANPEKFKEYPIHAIHWADRAAGNPSLKSDLSWLKNKAAMGGVDESIFAKGEPEQILDQVKEATNTMKNRPFILTPGCGLPLHTKEKNLVSFRDFLKS